MGRLEQLAADLVSNRMHPPDDPEVEKAAPFLWECLTQSSWGDGTERICSSIKIERVPGGYAVTLQDDSLCVRKTVQIAQLGELIAKLEAALPDRSVPWMPFKSYRNKKGVPEALHNGTGKKKRKS